MDRKTLLALVLSALVIIVWSSLFPQRRHERQPPTAERTTEEVGAPAGRAGEAATGQGAAGGDESRRAGDESGEAVPGEAAADQEIGQAASSTSEWAPGAEQMVEVVTDLTAVKISTVGGGLVDGLLFDYKSGAAGDSPVDLVREGQQVLDLTLVWRDPTTGETSSVERMRHVPFEVVRDEPIVASGGAGDAEAGADEGARPRGGHRVVLRARRSDGLEVTREYTFWESTYQFGHVVNVVTPEGGTPPDRVVIGWRAGMPHTEEANGGRLGMRQMFNALALVGDEIHEWNPGSFEKKGQADIQGNVRWGVVRNKYFLAAIVPAEGTATAIHADGDASSSRNEIWIDVPLSSRDKWSARFDVFMGPSDYDRLSALGNDLDQAVRLGPRILRPLGRLMLGIIKGTYKVVPNYGVVIILVSVFIRLILHPLNKTSMKSMKAMQELQPQMQALRKKYANDPQEMNKRMMELYKQHGVNPLGGCLPMLVQMPFLFALYYVLMFSVDLRMAPFVGWINDLSAPDTIGHVGGFSIHVLPLVMTGVSVLQARSTPKDPRQAAMTTMMPVLFLFLFYNMPSGLVLYWTVMNAMAWGQQALMNRGDHKVKLAAGDDGDPRKVRPGAGGPDGGAVEASSSGVRLTDADVERGRGGAAGADGEADDEDASDEGGAGASGSGRGRLPAAALTVGDRRGGRQQGKSQRRRKRG